MATVHNQFKSMYDICKKVYDAKWPKLTVGSWKSVLNSPSLFTFPFII